MSSSIESLVNKEYQYGFVTDIESDAIPKGLSEETVRLISARKHEPEWLLEWRLKAFKRWEAMTEPRWPNVKYNDIDYQAQTYYSAPKSVKPLQSLEEVDPESRPTTSEPLDDSAKPVDPLPRGHQCHSPAAAATRATRTTTMTAGSGTCDMPARFKISRTRSRTTSTERPLSQRPRGARLAQTTLRHHHER